MDHGDGGHGVESGLGIDDGGDGVEGDGAGSDVAVDGTGDDHFDWGVGVEVDLIAWVGLGDGGLELELDDGVCAWGGTLGPAHGDLADSGSATFGDGAEAAGEVSVGLDGFDGLFPAIDVEPEISGDEVKGFAEADVAECAFFDFGGEGGVVEARADFLLEGDAACGGVLDASDADTADVSADGGEGDRESVHEEAGVDARAEHSCAGIQAEGVELVGEILMAEPGIEEFLTGADDGHAEVCEFAQTGHAAGKVAGGGEEGGVEVFDAARGADGFGDGRSDGAGEPTFGNDRRERFADDGRIDVHGLGDDADATHGEVANNDLAEGSEADMEDLEHGWGAYSPVTSEPIGQRSVAVEVGSL